MLTVHIKCSNDTKYAVKVEESAKILELKELIEKEHQIPAAQQRLIYSGKVLKDEETVESYKIQDGNTVHLVRSGGAKPAAQATTPANNPSPAVAATQTATTTTTTSLPSVNAPFGNPAFNPFANAGQFGANPFAAAGAAGGGAMPPMDPEMLRLSLQMLSANPQLLQSVMASNPMYQQMSPEMREMMTSPEILRQMMDPAFINSMSQMMANNPNGMMNPQAMAGMNPLLGMTPPVANTTSTPGL